MKRNSFLKRARIVVYVLVLVVVGYHVLRYDLLRLPDGYCSPIARFSRRSAPRRSLDRDLPGE